MSGPGLKFKDSHSAIHEAALNEAKELNAILAKLLEQNQMDQAMKVALIAVEHWETRTLRHAEAEETGLYKELVNESEELNESIVRLTRDHNIMRFFVEKIKENLEQNKLNKEVLQQFYTLVQVDEFHNLEEERLLPHD